MGIHVNTLAQCEAETPGLRIRVAAPYVRVRRRPHGKPVVSAFYLLWFTFATGKEIVVKVEPEHRAVFVDRVDQALSELRQELMDLPGQSALSHQAQWFDFPSLKWYTEPKPAERAMYSVAFKEGVLVHGSPQTLSAWLQDHGISSGEFAAAMALIDPTEPAKPVSVV